METPTEARIRNRYRELRDLRRYLKKDERFIQVTRTVRQLREGRERQAVLRDFWEEMYDDHCFK
jgi:isochorismate hydrolase